MVSTRAPRYKFNEGERVLCYEPDPTKAKVLYDSKVLDVVNNKDNRGKKNVEYLIHFQGWNSSWDRLVSEEFVLKDTAENRQLQKDLAEKSQLQIGSYLYRKERKKNRKPSDRIAPSSEDGSCCSPNRMDTEESNSSGSGEEDSSIEDENVPIELTEDLRNILEHDYHLINNRNKVMKLPAEPNVVTILELYWRHYGTSLLYGNGEKQNSRHRTPSKITYEELTRSLNICKEMLDGLRIYFDFTLKDLLLYNKEQNQIEVAQAKFLSLNPSVKQNMDRFVKGEIEDLEYAHLPNMEMDDTLYDNCVLSSSGSRTRRRGLRSGRSLDTDTNGEQPEVVNNIKNLCGNSEVSGPASKILSWRLLPEHIYNQHPLPPSLVYGATHLLRLFIKLPELLNMCNMTVDKLKVLMRQLESFITFLDHHKEWYGDKFYTE